MKSLTVKKTDANERNENKEIKRNFRSCQLLQKSVILKSCVLSAVRHDVIDHLGGPVEAG